MWELVIWKLPKILFRRPLPTDFVVDKTIPFKTKAAAKDRWVGENAWRGCVDVPIAPMGWYKVSKGKRTLVCSQGWDDCWGDQPVYPKWLKEINA